MTEQQRRLVQAGYDQISLSYRSDDGHSNPAGTESTGPYEAWARLVSSLVPTGRRVLDLGCGAGVPMDRLLVDAGYRVLGVDISSVQIERACQLVPEADFIQADMTSLNLAPAAFDAVVCLYALIHIPLADQPAVLHRIRRWLVDGGYLLAIVGHEAHEGVAPYHGAPMFWSHADVATSLDWMRQARLEPLCHHYVPEGDVGHDLVLAQAC